MKNKLLEEVLVHGGEFRMGNTRKSKKGWEIEVPVHTVSLGYDFYIGKAPVTFNEYDEYCDSMGLTPPSDFSPKNNRAFGRGQNPVLNVTWWEAIAYCNWLSEKKHLPVSYVLKGETSEGELLKENGDITDDIRLVRGYRLLTEAEWEYSARGGNLERNDYQYSGGNKLDRLGWYWKNSGKRYLHFRDSQWPSGLLNNEAMPHEVMRKLPNKLGVYDMSGNVWEWCHDWFGEYDEIKIENPLGPNMGEQKIIRGGGWFFSSHTCRVSSRFYLSSNCSDFVTGFRIARTA